MFQIFKLSRSSVRLFRLPRYSTVSILETNTHNFKTVQVKYFRKHQRKKHEHYRFNTFPPLLLSWGFGIVFCEAVKLSQEEKHLLKACQYGLALEVKR